MAVTYNRLLLDIKEKPNDIITAVQNDTNSRYLDVFLYDNGVPINLDGCEVKIFMNKPEKGGEVWNNGVITEAENGRCEFLLTTEALTHFGHMQVQISIWKDNTEILSTQIFEIIVTKSLVGNSSVEASNEYGTLVILFQNLYEAYDLMTRMVENIGVPAEVAAQYDLATMWQAWEFLVAYMKGDLTMLINNALANSSVQGVLDVLDTTTAKEETSQEILEKMTEYGRGNYHTEYVFDLDMKVGNLDYGHAYPIILNGNGKLHILASPTDNYNYTIHYYQFDGENMTYMGQCNWNYHRCAAAFYNGAVHIFGSSSSTASSRFHKFFDGTQFVDSGVVGNFTDWQIPCAVVYDGKIHMMGGTSSSNYYHLTYDGTEWNVESNMNVNVIGDNCDRNWLFVHDGYIYYLKYGDKKLYRTTNSTWEEVQMPVLNNYPSYICYHEGKIYHLYDKYLYSWDFVSDEWIAEDTFQHAVTSVMCALNDILYVVYQNYSSTGDSSGFYRLTNPYIQGYMIKGTKVYSDYLHRAETGVDSVNKNIKFIADDCVEVLENGDTIIEFTVNDPTYVIA